MNDFNQAQEHRRRLILRLFDLGAVKFENVALKTGQITPAYFDLRLVVSEPQLMSAVADELWKLAQTFDEKPIPNLVCGVPYCALPLATCIASRHNVPMLICRKETKDYGTKKTIEGKFQAKQECMMIEDVIVYGTSVAECAQILRSEGLTVKKAVVLVDREQDAHANLSGNYQIEVKAVFTLSEILRVLLEEGKVSKVDVDRTDEFIRQNKFSMLPGAQTIRTNPNWSASEVQPTSRVNKLVNSYIREKRAAALSFAINVKPESVLTLLEKDLPIGAVKISTFTSEMFLSAAGGNLLQKFKALLKEKDLLLIVDCQFSGSLKEMIFLLEKVKDLQPDLITIHSLVGRDFFSGYNAIRERPALLLLTVAEFEDEILAAGFKRHCKTLAETFPNVISGLVAKDPFAGSVLDCAGSELVYWVDSMKHKFNDSSKTIIFFPCDNKTSASDLEKIL